MNANDGIRPLMNQPSLNLCQAGCRWTQIRLVSSAFICSGSTALGGTLCRINSRGGRFISD
jgi:hypothetical protein